MNVSNSGIVCIARNNKNLDSRWKKNKWIYTYSGRSVAQVCLRKCIQYDIHGMRILRDENKSTRAQSLLTPQAPTPTYRVVYYFNINFRRRELNYHPMRVSVLCVFVSVKLNNNNRNWWIITAQNFESSGPEHSFISVRERCI